MIGKLKAATYCLILIGMVVFKENVYTLVNSISGGNFLLNAIFFGAIAIIVLFLIYPPRELLKILPVVPLLALLGWAKSVGEDNMYDLFVPFFFTQLVGYIFCKTKTEKD